MKASSNSQVRSEHGQVHDSVVLHLGDAPTVLRRLPADSIEAISGLIGNHLKISDALDYTGKTEQAIEHQRTAISLAMQLTKDGYRVGNLRQRRRQILGWLSKGVQGRTGCAISEQVRVRKAKECSF